MELNDLQNKYGSQGLIVLAFPCNQFASQSPGTDDEFRRILQYIRPGNNYVPNFPLFGLLNVNGNAADPVFQYLRSECPINVNNGVIGDLSDISWTPVTTSDITWNFGKWLIRRDGTPFKRYGPNTDPSTLLPDILSLLGNQ